MIILNEKNKDELLDNMAGLFSKCGFSHKQGCWAPDCRSCLERFFAVPSRFFDTEQDSAELKEWVKDNLNFPVMPGDVMYYIIPPDKEFEEPAYICRAIVEDVSLKEIKCTNSIEISRKEIGREIFLTFEEAKNYAENHSWEFEME